MAPGAGKKYKIRLSTGRVLGPLDLDRIRLFIDKKKIIGVELAREHPAGDWKEIGAIPEIAELLLASARALLEGKPKPEAAASMRSESGYDPILGASRVQAASTQVLGPEQAAQENPPPGDDSDRTQVRPTEETPVEMTAPARARTDDIARSEQTPEIRGLPAEYIDHLVSDRNISREPTVIFDRGPRGGSLARTRKLPISRKALIAIAFLLGVYGMFLQDSGNSPALVLPPLRARLPDYVSTKPDPAKSAKLVDEALRFYLLDNVSGYREAADRLRRAGAQDPGNVKALALLASTYLNLIDSLDKDEQYFSVISKLIELAKSRSIDLPEIVIAEVEYFLASNRPEAAQNRIVEYTKLNPSFGNEMFYYLALAFHSRGDFPSAARFMANIPDNRAFSAKVYFLRAQIAQKLGETGMALGELEKAIRLNSDHMKSRLRRSELLEASGRLNDAQPDLDHILREPLLLPPRELARAFYLHGRLLELRTQWDAAIGDLEKAVRLDAENADYLLELYTLRAKAGDRNPRVKAVARMFYYLGEGEKLYRHGKYQEAINQFLEARRADERSPIPLVRLGDMFRLQHDLGSARLNYRKAADLAPKDLAIGSKYIRCLIESYEWEEAERAMGRYRRLGASSEGILDQAMGELYLKQNRPQEAQAYYRRAMARDSVEPTVYLAYGKSLLLTGNFKEAPFFFAIALRYDPTNTEAIIGTAKAVAGDESVDRAITILQDELQKAPVARAEMLAAIAELEIQRGELNVAEKFIEQAIKADPDYAYALKLRGQIALAQEGSDKKALDRALEAFGAYSDRNLSDPSGYLERYKIHLRRAEFQPALEELDKIYGLFPRYPELAYYRGALYSVQGNRKAAVEEFRKELSNHGESLKTLLALGKEYLELGAYSEALAQFAQAMQLAPAWAEAKHQAGYANYLLRNYPAAVALYNAALQTDSANPVIYKRLGLAHRAAGDSINAAKAFRKYLEMEPDAPDRAQFEQYR